MGSRYPSGAWQPLLPACALGMVPVLAAAWKLVIGLMLTFLHFRSACPSARSPSLSTEECHLGKDRHCVGYVSVMAKALVTAGVPEHGDRGTSSLLLHFFRRIRLRGSTPACWHAAHTHGLAHAYILVQGRSWEPRDGDSALWPLISKDTHLYFPNSHGAAEKFGLAVSTVSQIQGHLVTYISPT